jgi:hypothetical protein
VVNVPALAQLFIASLGDIPDDYAIITSEMMEAAITNNLHVLVPFKTAAEQPAKGGGWSRQTNEYADAAISGLQWLKNVRDGTSNVDEAIASTEENISRIQAEFDTTQPSDLADAKCPDCNGSGDHCLAGCSAHPSNWYTCETCKGTGSASSPAQRPEGDAVSDDAIMAALRKAGERDNPKFIRTVWKDGIDVDFPSHALRRVINALSTPPSAEPQADGYVPCKVYAGMKHALTCECVAEPQAGVVDRTHEISLLKARLSGRIGPFTARAGERWVDADVALRVLEDAIAALAPATGECRHEWVSGDNQYVSNAEFCLKCKTIRAKPATGETNEQTGDNK